MRNPINALYNIILVVIVAIALVIFGLVSLARAEVPRCGALAEVLTRLDAGYGETPVWEGAVGSGQTLLVTANPDHGSWTALVVEGGRACAAAAGTAWKGMVIPVGKGV